VRDERPDATGPALRGVAELMARQFNGSSQGMSVAQNMSALNILSISFWLWWDTYGTGNNLAMEFTADGTSTDGGFTIDPNAGGSVWTEWFRQNPGSTHQTDLTARPSAAAWHHHCIIFNQSAAIGAPGTGGTVHYVDGSVVGSTETGAVDGGNFANSTLYLMCRTGSTLWGAGRMADLALWTTVLSGGNITSLAGGARANTITPAPAVYWRIGGTTSPEPDFYGGIGLTLIGSPTSVADPPAFLSAPPITLFVLTDPRYGPRVVGSVFDVVVGVFPQPRESLLVFTQLLNGATVQEVSRTLPADLGHVGITSGGVQWLAKLLGLPFDADGPAPTVYQARRPGFPLLPLGAGTNAVRVRVQDGATVVFDESYPL
jgi:hypothetical protein